MHDASMNREKIINQQPCPPILFTNSGATHCNVQHQPTNLYTAGLNPGLTQLYLYSTHATSPATTAPALTSLVAAPPVYAG